MSSFFGVAENARMARAKRICKSYIASTGLYEVNIPYPVSTLILAKVGMGKQRQGPRAAKPQVCDLLCSIES
jgi:hypothetical protein